ncbi:hypothetical protein ACKFKG_25260 [Phormidesmis sp. 146-35]
MTGILTRAALTDLEQYVADDDRAERVKQVKAKIKDLGIQYIYYRNGGFPNPPFR